MKTKKSFCLPVLMAVLGIAAAVLRMGLYLFGRDERNLLIAAHPLNLLVWAVTAAAAAVILAALPKLGGSREYRENFAASVPAALGAFAFAGAIAAYVLGAWDAGSRMELLRNLAGLLAVPALIWAGMCRGLGKRPFFACHGLVCLFLTVYAISHYQTWSSRPQIQDYFFSMAAILLLALFAYYQSAFDADMGSRRMQTVTGLLAGFGCFAAAGSLEQFLLYLAGGIWALTNLCRPIPDVAEAARDNIHKNA